MSFLNPLFFIGSLVLTVPILVHLVRKDKSEIVRFSSLMFLLRIPRKTVRQQKLRNLLLMAMRLLLIALLVLAFARPYLVESNAALVPDSQSRGVVLLLDNSYSMTYGTNFERMKNEAANRIDGLVPGDVAALVAFNDRATMLSQASSDTNELKGIVNALEPSSHKTDYYEAFSLADRVLGQLEGYDRQLVVISDFQRNGWNRPARESVIDRDVDVEWVDLGEENPDNAGIDSVAVDATVFTRTYDGQLVARVNNHRLADATTVSIVLEINDRLIERRNVSIPAASSVLVEFTGFDLPLGYSRGRVRIEDEDSLMVDNEFIFVIHRRERMGLLIVDSGRPRQSFFLQQAFASAPELPFAVETVRASDLTPARLETADVVIINDVASLSDAIRNKLDELGSNGQGQLVFLGDNADLGWWNTFERLPVRLEGKVFVQRDRDRPFYSLTTYERSHEIFSTLEQSARLTLNTAQFSAYSEMESKPGAGIIAKLEDGSPLIVESASASGTEDLIVFGSSADNRWNDLPLKPAFLPLLHQVVRYLARYQDNSAWYQLGEAVPVPLASDQPAALITPDGQRVSLGEVSATGRRFFTPELAGFYEVRVGSDTLEVAADAPATESELEKMPPEDLIASAQRLEGEVREGALLREAQSDDFAQRQSWWWYLFLFALLLGIGEIYLGNRVTEGLTDKGPAVGGRASP